MQEDNIKRGATRRKASIIADEPIIVEPKQEPKAPSVDNANKKPSWVLIITTIVVVTLFAILLFQLKPGHKKTVVKNNNEQNLPKELIEIKPKYDFYNVLQRGADKFVEDELSKLEKEKDDLQKQTPAPVEQINAEQSPVIVEKTSVNAKEGQQKPASSTAQTRLNQEKPTINDKAQVNSKKDTQKVAPISKEATSKQLYFWRVGSFKTKNDADAVRAKLAIAGQIAQIETSTIQGETWHMVLVGPFRDKAKMINAQQQLTAQGFNNLLLQQRSVK